MTTPLTDRQRAVLLYVINFAKENGYPPTMHEIKDEFGYASANASRQHLSLIAKKGYLSMPDNGKARSIKVLRRIRESA